MFAVGENVGPYRITERLGHGGMAAVYRAYHANLDRYVAIKVMHTALREDPNFIARFRREAQIVAKLEHPHIVPIYDYDQYGDDPYLVMKFIEGETLKARLSQKALTLDETVRIMLAIGQALTYAHERGILHRDIKPSNILLDTKGEAYLADFGLARIAGAGESTMSQDMMLGTPHYISPEQAQGLKDLDAGTDIYSLGVVLYELVVGRVPFNADTPYAIVHDHIFSPLPLPSRVNPQVPEAVERVLLKALAKDRADRYPTAIGMVEAFSAAVKETNPQFFSPATYRANVPQSSTPAAIPKVAAPGTLQLKTPFPIPASGNPAALSPTPTPIPIPVPTMAGSRAGSTFTERYKKQQRRASLWMLGGFTTLIMSCLVGLYIAVAAYSDANIRAGLFLRGDNALPVPTSIAALNRTVSATQAVTLSATDSALSAVTPVVTQAATQTATDRPTSTLQTASATATDGPSLTPDSQSNEAAFLATLQVQLNATPASTPDAATPNSNSSTLTDIALIAQLGTLAPREIFPFVRDHPADPIGNIALGIALGRQRQSTLAGGYIEKGVMLARNTPDALITLAQELDSLARRNPLRGVGYTNVAISLYAYAWVYGSNKSSIRQEAGSRLYTYAQVKRPDATDLLRTLATPNATGFLYAVLALSAQTNNRLNEANDSMNKALKLSPNLPETRLIHGIIALNSQDYSAAQGEFTFARTAADAPTWVVKEADHLTTLISGTPTP